MKHWWPKSQTGWWVELGKCNTIFFLLLRNVMVVPYRKKQFMLTRQTCTQKQKKAIQKRVSIERQRQRTKRSKPIKWMIHNYTGTITDRQMKSGEKSEHLSRSLNSKFNNISLSVQHWPKTDVNADINKNWFKESQPIQKDYKSRW